MSSGILNSTSVLILENQPFIALDMAMTLKRKGCACHIAHRISCALELLAQETFDLALLDLREINFGDRRNELPAVLHALCIPYALIVGGHTKLTVDAYRKDAPRLDKPFTPDQLIKKAVELFKYK